MRPSTRSIQKQLDDFMTRLLTAGIASETDLAGCSDEQIALLERKYAVRLPESYRWYLKRMGHSSVRLFTHDHVRASYDDVLVLTEQERARQQSFPVAERVELPTDALVILDRLGEQHLFIRCEQAQEPPVLCYNDWDREVVESHASVLDWLETWREEAAAAIREGYYGSQSRSGRTEGS